MTRFWCPWCGETATSDDPNDRVPCMRCVREFLALFRFWPEAAMVPLSDGEDPGEPAAARKRFTFRAQDGRVIGSTWSPQEPARTRGDPTGARSDAATSRP